MIKRSLRGQKSLSTWLIPIKYNRLLANSKNYPTFAIEKEFPCCSAFSIGVEWILTLHTYGKPVLIVGHPKYQLVENGVYVPKYKMTVPKELYEYE